tara:strand:- start:1492 stop:2475 length:984 start_codon:yes stop_codon:yes gene_type:complete
MNSYFKFDEKEIKKWSLIGSRATFGLASFEIAKNLDNFYIVTADVSTSAGLDRYRKNFPDKYVDVGIAEQNMMGVAAGLASEGNTVITTTFAPFQTMRCCEQIKVNLGYMKQKVIMVGLASGLVLGTLGYTHCCIEDLSIMRSIPNITVLSPSDPAEAVKCLEASIHHNTSVYIRLTGSSNSPIVNSKDYIFEIGKSIELVKGEDITIFATGTMVYEALQAANILNEHKIYPNVVNIHTIKQLDTNDIIKYINKSKIIVTMEEHNIIGGLGSAIAEINSKTTNSAQQLFIGMPDVYDNGGEYKDIKEKYGLSANLVAKQIFNSIEKS